MGILGDDKPDQAVSGLKITVLLLLLLQNSGHALLTRYSQGVLQESYSSTEVVIVAELLKLIVSMYLLLNDTTESDSVGKGLSKLLWLAVHGQKMIILVLLYTAANVMSYYALARVEASVYTVTLQLKIVTTAFFSVTLMGRNINATKWRALFHLVLGCILVASPAFNKPDADNCNTAISEGDPDGAGRKVSQFESMLGVGAVLIMVSISGYSAIYFEQLLKKSSEKVTIWERNFQLALYSLLVLIIYRTFEHNYSSNVSAGSLRGGVPTANVNGGDSAAAAASETIGLFHGWTIYAFLIATIQGAGGLLVATTLKYADAVLKTMATSGSIVVSAVIGWIFLGGTLDIFVAIGCISTILAIFGYVFAPND